ncbi:hypothetical protein EC915_101952 [Pseudomonas sp. LP_7_YM]|nr:hypothetical protein EC915_101952 [Pseudomonas sp. LP_7_YM]
MGQHNSWRSTFPRSEPDLRSAHAKHSEHDRQGAAADRPLKTGAQVRVRWATADACVYTQWAESDLNKVTGAR